MLHQNFRRRSTLLSSVTLSDGTSSPSAQARDSQKRRGNFAPSRRSGQALIEFAIVAPLLIGLTMGMIQYAIIFNATIAVNNVSREGARGAAVDFDYEEVDPADNTKKKRLGKKKIKDRMQKATQGTLIQYRDIENGITITPDPDATVGQGTPITVSVTYPMKNKVFFPTILGVSVFASNYTSSTTMRKE